MQACFLFFPSVFPFCVLYFLIYYTFSCFLTLFGLLFIILAFSCQLTHTATQPLPLPLTHTYTHTHCHYHNIIWRLCLLLEVAQGEISQPACSCKCKAKPKGKFTHPTACNVCPKLPSNQSHAISLFFSNKSHPSASQNFQVRWEVKGWWEVFVRKGNRDNRQDKTQVSSPPLSPHHYQQHQQSRRGNNNKTGMEGDTHVMVGMHKDAARVRTVRDHAGKKEQKNAKNKKKKEKV